MRLIDSMGTRVQRQPSIFLSCLQKNSRKTINNLAASYLPLPLSWINPYKWEKWQICKKWKKAAKDLWQSKNSEVHPWSVTSTAKLFNLCAKGQTGSALLCPCNHPYRCPPALTQWDVTRNNLKINTHSHTTETLKISQERNFFSPLNS